MEIWSVVYLGVESDADGYMSNDETPDYISDHLAATLEIIIHNLHHVWLPRSIQFLRKLVGYNSALDSNRIEVSTAPSLIACGRFGFKKNCTSFLYETTDSQCTLYSVFMIGDGQLMNNYYATKGTEETINVVDTCLTYSHNSMLTNVAFGKTVTMSSVHKPGSLLVNGVRNGMLPCAHTFKDVNPYMMVDLGQNYNVHSLYVLNRKDCCGERLFNVTIELAEKTKSMKEYVYRDGLFGTECTFVLDHVTVARYVRLSVVGETFLTVCELGVYSLS